MPYTNITTIRNGGNLSRHEMLKWINNTAQEHIKRIEDLSNGVVYCRLMEEIFPNIINMKRVKMAPRLKYEYVHNLRILQDAFNILELEQPVPIDLIIQGRFKHNFEFIQFFKKFYDSQTQPPPKKKLSGSRKSVRSSHSMARRKSWMETTPQGMGNSVRVPVHTEDLTPEWEDFPHKYPMPVIAGETEYMDDYQDIQIPLANHHFDEVNQEIQVNQVQRPKELQEDLIEDVIKDRDLAYNKLFLIEQILPEMLDVEQWMTRSRIINVLKAPMEDEVQAGEGDTADFTPLPQ